MNTVNGPLKLDYTTSATILDFHTGLRKNIIIVKHGNQKIVEFIINNNWYYLGFDWKILQPTSADPRGFILVGEIIEKKLEFIYDKFNRKHFLQGVILNNGPLARPEEQYGFTFYDKNLVIQID